MTEPSLLPLYPWDPAAEIEARFPEEPKVKGRLALIKDGAIDDEASLAIEKIARRCARYIASGPFESVPDTQVKAEIVAVAKAAEQLDRAINAMSTVAAARLNVGLWPEIHPRNKAPRFRNPDPIYESPKSGALSPEGFNRRIQVPADMSEKLDRVAFDIAQLAPLIRQIADFQPRRGRPENWRVGMLFEEVIAAWSHAAGQAPAASQQEGVVISPLLDLLRELVYPTTEHPELGAALSDAIYLRVLARMKTRTVGLISRRLIQARRKPS